MPTSGGGSFLVGDEVGMSYTLPEKRAIIEFEEYPGLEVTVRLSPVPMGGYFEIMKLVEGIGHDLTALQELTEKFAPIGLIEWTLPEPATAEGMVAQPYGLALAIVAQWVKAVAEVPIPLPLGSSAGEPSVETDPPS